jgi:predicted SnoaL-like aldol condensation-catalyzing enzyme
VATQARKDAAIEFLSLIVAGDVRRAYERHVGSGFLHHNPYFPGDAESLEKGMEEDESRNPGKKLEVQVALQDGDYVAIHSRLSRAASDLDMAVVHLFRFEREKIAELWDVGQAVPKSIANKNGMF